MKRGVLSSEGWSFWFQGGRAGLGSSGLSSPSPPWGGKGCIGLRYGGESQRGPSRWPEQRVHQSRGTPTSLSGRDRSGSNRDRAVARHVVSWCEASTGERAVQ